MANVLKVSEAELEKADAILQKAETGVRLAAAVKMVFYLKIPLVEAMSLLGLSKATVWRRWEETFSEASVGTQRKSKHGGRHRQHLSVEEEKAFLEQWHQKALEGQVVTVAEMKEAFEKKSDKTITDVGFYKLLRRHRWRKLKPDTKHPKADFEAQEDFKKKPFPNCCAGGQSRRKTRWAWFPGDVSG
jgi:transposase